MGEMAKAKPTAVPKLRMFARKEIHNPRNGHYLSTFEGAAKIGAVVKRLKNGFTRVGVVFFASLHGFSVPRGYETSR